MPVAFVAASQNVDNTGSTTTGFRVDSTFAATDGNLLVLALNQRGSSGVTPPAGFSLAVTDDGNNVGIWYKLASSDSSGTTYAFTDVTADENSVIIAEFSGVSTSSPVDQTATFFGTASTNEAPTGTTAGLTSTGQLAVGVVGPWGVFGGTTPFVSWSNSYSRAIDADGNNSGDNPGAMSWLDVGNSSAAQTTTGTWTTNANFRFGAIATFTLSTGAPPAGTIVPTILHQAALRRS